MDPNLYRAVENGNVHILDQQNADLLQAQVTPSNNTLLHLAALFGQTPCLNIILQKCGQSLLFSVNQSGDTALHISTRGGHTDMVEALLEYANQEDAGLESRTGASKELLRMRNVEGDTALYDAVRANNLDLVKILTKEDPEFVHPPNNANESPLFLAAESGYQEIVYHIVENCASPAYFGPNGRTALHAAVLSTGGSNCLHILHRWRPSLTQEADVYGWIPVHYAAWIGNRWRVGQLLEMDISGAYLVVDDDNRTALHIAASQGHAYIMEEILSRCPDCWNAITNKGQNILHLAAENEENLVVKYISAKSFANFLVNQRDNDGNTPLHLQTAACRSHGNHCTHDLRTHPGVHEMAHNKKSLTPLEIRFGGASKVWALPKRMFLTLSSSGAFMIFLGLYVILFCYMQIML